MNHLRLYLEKFVLGRFLAAVLLFLAVGVGGENCEAEDSATTESAPWIWLWNGRFLGGYQEIADPSADDFSASNEWRVTSAYRMDPETLWMLSYTGGLDLTHLLVAQDEGGREVDKTMNHDFSAAVKRRIGSEWEAIPAFFYDIHWLKDTADESLGRGLYDYEDIGGRVGFQTKAGLPGDPLRRRHTLSYFRREYPHFRSLSCEFLPDQCAEEREKDFDGYLYSAESTARWKQNLTLSGKYVFLYEDYPDKRTIDENGVLQSDSRRDFYQEAEAELRFNAAASTVLSLTSGLAANLSNLDYYDTRNTASPEDDRFFDSYFDYLSWFVGSTVRVALARPDAKETARGAPSVEAGYRFEGLRYLERDALDGAGRMSGERQKDEEHSVRTQISIPLDGHWAWQLRVSYLWRSSNNDYEDFYVYSYQSWSALSGLTFDY